MIEPELIMEYVFHERALHNLFYITFFARNKSCIKSLSYPNRASLNLYYRVDPPSRHKLGAVSSARVDDLSYLNLLRTKRAKIAQKLSPRYAGRFVNRGTFRLR